MNELFTPLKKQQQKNMKLKVLNMTSYGNGFYLSCLTPSLSTITISTMRSWDELELFVDRLSTFNQNTSLNRFHSEESNGTLSEFFFFFFFFFSLLVEKLVGVFP